MLVRILLTALLAIGVASAQRGGGGGGGSKGGGGGGGGMGGFGAQRQSLTDVIADKLKLSKEQKEELAPIISSGREAAGPLVGQINQGRTVIAQAIVQGKSGEEINQMMSQYTDLLAKMAAVEATAYAKIYALLKPNQQSKATAVFDEQMSGMFMSAGGRRGQQ